METRGKRCKAGCPVVEISSFIYAVDTPVRLDELERTLEAGGLQKPRVNVHWHHFRLGVPVLRHSERGRLQIT